LAVFAVEFKEELLFSGVKMQRKFPGFTLSEVTTGTLTTTFTL
jgi:hypothetical protein